MDPVHPIADRMEPRVERALDGAFERMRERLPMEALTEALARGDARKAGELIDGVDFADALTPAAEILKDTFTRGGKVLNDD